MLSGLMMTLLFLGQGAEIDAALLRFFCVRWKDVPDS